VYETPADIEDLQIRRDHSITQASPFFAQLFRSARARHLAQRPAAG
jgi:hypothetical protein